MAAFFGRSDVVARRRMALPSLLGLLFTGVVALLLNRALPAGKPNFVVPASFQGSSSLAAAKSPAAAIGGSADSLLAEDADSLTARSAYTGRVKRVPFVEPTIPQELIDEAEKEGFRLRPKYHHMKVGYVVSDKNKRTRIAHVEYFLFNAKLGAYYKQSKRFHYHDHYEISKLGDVVLIAPTKKRSNMKAYRIIEVLKNNTAPVRV